MKSIDELIATAIAMPDCIMHPPNGQPILSDPRLQLPDDLRYFYDRAGGCSLFASADFGYQIVAPSTFAPANPLRLPLDYYREHRQEYDASPTATWYLIATGTGPEEAISIDLSPARLGRCYDSFHEVHATADSAVIALSFSELFSRLLDSRGTDIWWRGPRWIYGKAFDHEGA